MNPEPDLLLLSGGIESAALLRRWCADNRPVIAAWADYGQRNAARERAAVRALAEAEGVRLETVETGALREAFTRRSDWVGHVPLPQRNLLILALAVNLAQHHGAGRILLALNREDAGHGPGSGAAFLQDFGSLAARLVPGLSVAAPLQELGKADIIRRGAQDGVPWRLTWSCLLGQERHCGRCPQCHARQAAFTAAGVPDPTDYRQPPGPRTP